MMSYPNNPTLKGRSSGADANRTVCGRRRSIVLSSSRRLVGRRPLDLPIRAGTLGFFLQLIFTQNYGVLLPDGMNLIV
jgi:hypothetical protein